jgi:hypothetical protein
MTRECVICGTVFEPRNSNRPAATCSRACRNRLQWQRVPVRKKRTVKARKVYEFRCARCCAISYGSKPKKYCSLSCSATAKSRGGLSFSVKEGRWRVRTRDGGYMNFARCVMEAHIRRPLAADEEVPRASIVVAHRSRDAADRRCGRRSPPQRPLPARQPPRGDTPRLARRGRPGARKPPSDGPHVVSPSR